MKRFLVEYPITVALVIGLALVAGCTLALNKLR
jgi:hypothetical protein